MKIKLLDLLSGKNYKMALKKLDKSDQKIINKKLEVLQENHSQIKNKKGLNYDFKQYLKAIDNAVKMSNRILRKSI